jgi:hypothetical protein
MSLFSGIIRDIQESKEGRIHRVPGNWKLAPGETREDGCYKVAAGDDVTSGGFVRVSTDKRGRKMHLISKRAVHFTNPEYLDQFASIMDDCICLSVPESFCRKCPHYRTARQSRRKYATCGYARAENPAEATLEEFGGLLSKATTKANEILGGD